MPGTKDYPGAAAPTTLATGLTDGSDLTCTISANTGWPTGSAGAFVARIARGVAGKEEKVLIATQAGGALTISARGYDGTTAVAHDPGETIECVFDADSAKEFNAHVNDDGRDDHSQYLNTTRHSAISHLVGTHVAASGTTPTDVSGTAGTAGDSTAAARANHRHQIASTVPRGLFSPPEVGTGGGQSGITTITDITGVSQAITPGNGRWLRVECQCPFTKSGTAGEVTLSLREGSDVIQQITKDVAANDKDYISFVAVFQYLDAASHTLKLSLTSVGGSVSTIVQSDSAPTMAIHDIGG